MKVKFKKLHDEAVLPSYAKHGDAGLDLTAVSVDSSNEDFVEYRTGLASEVPEGHVGLIFPRSSVSKKDLVLANSVGVLDCGYRGEILIRFKRVLKASDRFVGEIDNHVKAFKAGERVAQLIIIPIPLIEPEFADELSDTERGDGGFGHTGK